jgi:molybdopterin-containing oxidoreductase family iron-sulfur binding subunit
MDSMITDYAPIDADGHVMETDDELRRYLPAPFEGRRALTAIFPSLDPVCPVFATQKDEEGFVAQIYPRCIGCRYCTTACPYTVRDFNWRRPEWPAPMEQSLSPDVSVRPRGVVEKCTFCHHRLQLARDEARAEGRPLREQDYVPACVQTCPANAMAFGDLDDPRSAVARLSRSPRAFRLLEELGTEPKVIYLSKGEWGA